MTLAQLVLPVFAGLSWLVACSSGSHPAALGKCVGTPDAACGSPASSSGGGSGPGDGGTGAMDTGGVASDSGSCGTAAQLLNTLNNMCVPCVTGSAGISGCCQVAEACTGQCLSLLQCTGGINVCEAQFPAGVTAYNDFADCLARSCPTQCPTLPKATAGDF